MPKTIPTEVLVVAVIALVNGLMRLNYWLKRNPMKTLRLKLDPLRDYEAADIPTLRSWIESAIGATADDETIRKLWRDFSGYSAACGWMPPVECDFHAEFIAFCREKGAIE